MRRTCTIAALILIGLVGPTSAAFAQPNDGPLGPTATAFTATASAQPNNDSLQDDDDDDDDNDDHLAIT